MNQEKEQLFHFQHHKITLFLLSITWVYPGLSSKDGNDFQAIVTLVRAALKTHSCLRDGVGGKPGSLTKEKKGPTCPCQKVWRAHAAQRARACACVHVGHVLCLHHKEEKEEHTNKPYLSFSSHKRDRNIPKARPMWICTA